MERTGEKPSKIIEEGGIAGMGVSWKKSGPARAKRLVTDF